MNFKKIITATLTTSIAVGCIALPDNIISKKLDENIISANAQWENGEKDFRYYTHDDDTVEIAYYEGEKENPIVPYMLAGKVVTGISGIGEAWQGAFEGCINPIKSVTIPASIQHIDKNAFGSDSDNVSTANNVVINCYAGSYAEEFAKENGFEYNIIPHEEHSYTTTLKWPTFSEEGYCIKQCEECGYWYKESKQDKLILNNVSGFTVASTSENAIKLKWDNMYQHWNRESQADGYIIYRYNTKTQKYSRIAKVSSCTYTDQNLSSGTSYKYAIRAYVIENNKEVLSPSFPTLLASTNPANVTGFKTSATSAAAIKLTWNKVSGANGYIVYRNINGKWKRVGNVTTNSFYEGKLASGTNYKYAVRAYKTINGKEVLSSSYPTLLTSTNPATVNFKLTAGSKKATVSWNKVNGATGYIVYYKTSANGSWQRLKTTTGTSYTKTGLTSGKTYYFTVKAYKTTGGKTYNGTFVTKSVKVQ